MADLDTMNQEFVYFVISRSDWHWLVHLLMHVCASLRPT